MLKTLSKTWLKISKGFSGTQRHCIYCAPLGGWACWLSPQCRCVIPETKHSIVVGERRLCIVIPPCIAGAGMQHCLTCWWSVSWPLLEMARTKKPQWRSAASVGNNHPTGLQRLNHQSAMAPTPCTALCIQRRLECEVARPMRTFPSCSAGQ